MGSKISSEQPINTDNIIQKRTWIQKLFCIRDNRKFILGIIDPQNDFFEKGKLPIPNANKIIGPINKLRFICYQNKTRTFISQNSYLPTHISFASTHNKEPFTKIMVDLVIKNQENIIEEQFLWPTHCVKNSTGADFHPDLFVFHTDKIIQKGTNINVNSYSAFGDKFNNLYENTGLAKWLQVKKPTDIILVGISTQSCIGNTALEAIKKGYSVHIILSCVYISELNQQTTNEAIIDMKSLGVIFYDDIENFVLENKTKFSYTNIFI